MNVYIHKPVNYSDMQGPCDSGFHVPTKDEWGGLKTIMDGLGLTTGDNWRINLHMPFAGNRLYSDASRSNQGTYGYYWSSSPYTSLPERASIIFIHSASLLVDAGIRTFGYPVRCFKNSFELPTSSWTVINGTLGGAGIFWDTVNGLISITGDGATGYTIQDKNVGATSVYNDGNTLTQANMGNMYQWGNNYGFPSTGSVTTSSTQVNAQNYGPGNYYSSSTFITRSSSPYDWSSVQNDNLRGGVSGAGGESELKNAYIGEYSIPTDGLLAYYPLVSDAKDHKADIGATGTTYDGTWVGTASYGTVGGKTGALFSRGSNRINTGLNRSSLPITLCAYFYHTNSYDWETLIGNNTGNNSRGFAIRMTSVIVVTNGSGNDLNTTIAPTVGVWKTIVMTIQNGTTKVYENGVLNSTFSSGTTGGSTFYIASYGAYTTYGFNGYIKDVAIYNRVLSADEVSLYHQIVTK